MTTAQRLRLIFELQRIQKVLDQGVRMAAEAGDNYIADLPKGNRFVAEAGVLLGTVNTASARIDTIIDGLKSKGPGADDTEAGS